MSRSDCFYWDGRAVEIDAAAFGLFYGFLRETPGFFQPGETPTTDRAYGLSALALTEGEQWAQANGVEFDWGIDERAVDNGNPLWLCGAVMNHRVVRIFPGVECVPGVDPSDSDFGRAVQAWLAFQLLSSGETECNAACPPLPRKRRARRPRQLCAA